jgi:hypothetical protein
MSCVEHLKFWREYVGYKNKNMTDKRDTSTYKVRKEKRLKSFMEKITKKRKAKIQKVAELTGINIPYRAVGDKVSSGEEADWDRARKLKSPIPKK